MKSESFISTEIIASFPHLGTRLRALRVKEVKPGLHESAEGISRFPIYSLHWKRDPARLFGRWRAPATGGESSGRFVRLPLPLARQALEASSGQDATRLTQTRHDLAVFLSTNLSNARITLVMAVQQSGQWTELCRWDTTWVECGLSRMDICDV